MERQEVIDELEWWIEAYQADINDYEGDNSPERIANTILVLQETVGLLQESQ